MNKRDIAALGLLGGSVLVNGSYVADFVTGASIDVGKLIVGNALLVGAQLVKSSPSIEVEDDDA